MPIGACATSRAIDAAAPRYFNGSVSVRNCVPSKRARIVAFADSTSYMRTAFLKHALEPTRHAVDQRGVVFEVAANVFTADCFTYARLLHRQR
ncbi:hypothetical protein [Paraburkholderia solisilvae]|uniref:Uncharacterized protein n=1 Tax=Paraburkholderia solisilvae TaxID=624376 RepID=A0A6J5E9S3_9BURK|nr:hypothetical protein [Paraburkholderia solisilvae]CAB3762071.1 hypothetical protein LMG29739_03778 [Paraburkholderia solisilvae]